MASVNAGLIFTPITVFVILTVMFGEHDNSPVIQDIDLIQDLIASASSREECNATFTQCSNVDCSFITFPGGFETPEIHICGDTFYVLLILGTILSVPFLAVGIPILLMLPVTEITIFTVTYVLTDFWYFYAPLWGMFAVGIAGVIW